MKKATLTLFALVLGNCAASIPASGLTITHRERSLQPGEVVVITIKSPRPLKSAEAVAFGKRFSFFPGPDATSWHGLIGIDPELKAGRVAVGLLTTGVDGKSERDGCFLEIRRKVFPTRRLSVEQRYVTPPPEVEERIRTESLQVEEIFRAVTRAKLWQGPFVVPVAAPASSSFGRRTILNGQPRSPHWGTDFNADTGAPVNAPNGGRIALAADLYFSGKTIIIDHGLGLYSYLAHLSQISVSEGAEVRTGQLIGKVGSTGRATGPHLHWTVRLAGMRVDPISLVAVLSGK